ncbi:gamma-glutamyl-gamma-aminobutyrate hydrolase family protein [Desulfovibrio oxyclinae]|uniref:gamma-glutamyl-gamma-aminobutyrate hydrolase family protein n=1 Tax=Desulfovibrio oxyclinae TaxID=63560 RepID=UPI00047794C2|nr:gamma-glutamyl-gamma-aminobutyrate hydrolase family protein [Desulfovibrio oxyclinae]
MARPVIGVCGPDKGGGPAWWFTALAVFRAGGRPVRITPKRPRQIHELDGLVLGGGADVSPETYGMEALDPGPKEKPKPTDLGLAIILLLLRWLFGLKFGPKRDPARDDLELHLLTRAMDKNMPVLGICRGCQLMNVHLGGSLHQDLRDFYEEHPQIQSVLPRKRILLQPQTRLAELLRARTVFVNALHRQAVNDVAPGLVVAARELNQVIQAVEHSENRFMLGVQWHPEYMPQSKRQQGLFQALVKAARD